MKRIFLLFIAAWAALGLVSCGGFEDPVLDNSFVYIADSDDVVYNDKETTTTLFVTLSTPKTSFDATVEVYYELIPGNGLKEGVDFRIKQGSESPLKFTTGNFVVPMKIEWLKNPSFDSSKDNTLKIKLTGSNLAYLQMGNSKLNYKSTFVFTKKATKN